MSRCLERIGMIAFVGSAALLSLPGCGATPSSQTTPTVTPSKQVLKHARFPIQARWPVVGAATSTAYRYWTPRPTGYRGKVGCYTFKGVTDCEFTDRGIYYTTGSIRGVDDGTINDIQLWGYRDPASTGHWLAIARLVPPGAVETGCRYIRYTGGAAGPAHVCVYSWHGHNIAAAQYLAPTNQCTFAEVMLDATYDNVRLANGVKPLVLPTVQPATPNSGC